VRACVGTGVREDTALIDYDEVEALAKEHKPKLIIAGGSAYARCIDFARFRQIADSVGAYLVVDMAHFSGLVAGSCPTLTLSLTHPLSCRVCVWLGVMLRGDGVVIQQWCR